MSSRLVELDSTRFDAELVRRAYDQVLHPSFPSSELPPFVRFVEDLRHDPSARVLVLLDAGAPVGVSVDHCPPEARIGLLAYLAARPGRRSEGIGSTLMTALRERWRRDPVDLVIAEVEDPRVHAEGADNRPWARLAFYERHGAELVMLPWVQPGLGGEPRVPGMILLRLWAVSGGPSSVPSSLLAAWTDVYYAVEEGAVPTDPTFRALRRRLEVVPQIPVRPIAALDDLELLGVE